VGNPEVEDRIGCDHKQAFMLFGQAFDDPKHVMIKVKLLATCFLSLIRSELSTSGSVSTVAGAESSLLAQVLL
jgi:hypothetical protein